MNAYLSLIEEATRQFRFDGQPRSLYDPIHYIMGLGGKRIRPTLTLMAYALYRQDVKDIVKYAVAVEAFHNFTLVHDDIMDQAPIRRGKPTVHEKWNTNTAILSGDVMLVKVYDQFLDLEPSRLKSVLELFNACAAGVCEGQQQDMEFEVKDRVTEEQYLKMIRLKTATLLGFSLELGALLANAPPADRTLLREIGINLGIAFQLRDDLLDVYADERKFGKRQGGDIVSNKKTYLLIQARKRAKGAQKKELEKWLSAKKFDPQKKVKAVTAIYDSLGIREVAEEKIQDFLALADNALERLTVGANASAMRAMVDQLAGRQH